MTSAERNDFAGPEAYVVAVSLRHDITDEIQIYDIAVVASEESMFRKSSQNIGDLAGFSEDLAFAVKDQAAVIGFNIMTFWIIESIKLSGGGEPEGRFRQGDSGAWFVMLDCPFQLLQQFQTVFFGNLTDCDDDFFHNSYTPFKTLISI